MTELFHLEPTELITPKGKPPIKTPKRVVILRAIAEKDTLSLDEAIALIGRNYYCNERFHTGNVLSAMVKAGLLQRIKPGLFAKP